MALALPQITAWRHVNDMGDPVPLPQKPSEGLEHGPGDPILTGIDAVEFGTQGSWQGALAARLDFEGQKTAQEGQAYAFWGGYAKAVSPEDQKRSAIQCFDVRAVQKLRPAHCSLWSL